MRGISILLMESWPSTVSPTLLDGSSLLLTSFQTGSSCFSSLSLPALSWASVCSRVLEVLCQLVQELLQPVVLLDAKALSWRVLNVVEIYKHREKSNGKGNEFVS